MNVERVMVNGHELTAFDLPPEPSETYEVYVDGLGEIVVENGKPPKEKDVPAMYMRKLVPELCEQNAALFRENAALRQQLTDVAESMGRIEERCAKLRELVHILAYCMSEDRDCDRCVLNGADMPMPRISACDELLDRMRELGMEVETE